MTTNDEQYREALGYYTRGRDEGYPLDPDLITGEGGDEYRAEFDRFLARVRQDAAREALDGLAEWADLRVREAITDKGADDWRRTRFAVVAHRDARYPEETP